MPGARRKRLAYPRRVLPVSLAASVLWAILLLAAPSHAHAREVVLARQTAGGLVGPVLSDGRVVWGESRADLTGKRLKLATAAGRSRVILRVPDPASGQTSFRALSASGRRIAVLIGSYDQPAPPRLLVASGGPFRTVGLAPGCETRTADIDGPRIAYLAYCAGTYKVGVKGADEAINLNGMPVGTPSGPFEFQVRVAGRYLAWAEATFPPVRPRIVVYDLRRHRTALALELARYLQGGYEGVGSKWLGFDLDKRGRVAFMAGVEPETRPRVVGWASPAHPTVHRLRHHAQGVPAIAGGLIALQRPRDYAVVDLKGKVVDVFERRRTHGGGVIAFDGRRLAWTGMSRLRRSPFTRWDLVTNLLKR